MLVAVGLGLKFVISVVVHEMFVVCCLLVVVWCLYGVCLVFVWCLLLRLSLFVVCCLVCVVVFVVCLCVLFCVCRLVVGVG